MAVLTIRCRHPAGHCTLEGVDSGMSLEDFQTLLADKTGVAPAMQEIRMGFPPVEVDLPNNRKMAKVSMLGLASQELIVLTEKLVRSVVNPLAACESQRLKTSFMQDESALQDESSPSAPPFPTDIASDMEADEEMDRAIAMSLEETCPTTSNKQDALRKDEMPVASHQMPDGSFIVRRYVDSDNWCLFTAVGYVMDHNRYRGLDLRSVIADAVAADPISYTEAVLGKPPAEYCSWILSPQNWGGEIELLILSQFYESQIAAFDIKSKKCFIYGSDRDYQDRVFLLYDGLHYDALALSPGDQMPEDLDVTRFQPRSQHGQMVMEGAQKLVEKLHATLQFTDTGNFTLRCGNCGRGFVGEKTAMEHAQETGHCNFQQYK